MHIIPGGVIWRDVYQHQLNISASFKSGFHHCVAVPVLLFSYIIVTKKNPFHLSRKIKKSTTALVR